MAERSGVWDGGYIHKDARGREVYVIRQQINGKRYEVSTRTFSARAAIEQLKRFQSDPEAYDPRGVVALDAVYLDEKLVEEFLKWSRVEKGNTKNWLGHQKGALSWWADRLIGADLRRCDLDQHIRPVLQGAAGKHHRIATLKCFFHWLRTGREGGPEKRLKLAEDPTLSLESLPARPATKVKALPRDVVDKVLSHLGPPFRDALQLQSEVGWHTSEVIRFCDGGEIEEPTDEQRGQGAAGILVVKHKGGQQHRSQVSQPVLEAATRLRKVAGFSEFDYIKTLKKACAAAEVNPFGPGQLRHSVATWLVNGGTPLPVVSTFLGHKSPATTKAFYVRHATPVNPGLLKPVAK